MKLRTPIKILLSLCLFAGTLCLLPNSESFGVSTPNVSATISATATVIEPLGLIAQPTSDLGQQFLLYAPHAGRTICQVSYLSGSSSALRLSGQEFVSSSNLPARIVSLPTTLGRGGGATACVVTLIYTEN